MDFFNVTIENLKYINKKNSINNPDFFIFDIKNEIEYVEIINVKSS